MKIVAAQKMPDRHFYLLRHHIFFYSIFLVFCSLAPDRNSFFRWRGKKGLGQKSMVFIGMKISRWRHLLSKLSGYYSKRNEAIRRLWPSLLFSYGETVLWLKSIIFWAIPLSFQHKLLICYQKQTAAETKFYAEL